MGELHNEQNDDMQECMMAQEEQAYCQAVSDVAGFIASGAVSKEQFEIDLREAMK
jgi:hypothetical protein